jgi:Predicted membrane protein (DUF2207)
MKRHKPSLIFLFFVCGTFLCAGIGGAQPTDRILAFDSRITIDRDRTMHVQEKLEIANDTGLFDDGIHRRLWIKRVTPQRVKAGSFQSVGAKVDGDLALFSTSEDGGVFDIRIATGAGTLSRGNHVIDLSYVAKHQFRIYKNYEDLDEDISGEWPVSIEKATVELNFFDELPQEVGISADTGTESQFKFDCVRTNLPSGVKFETTHFLAPGNSLFISATFPHPGYFVSNVKEDGFRAVWENHPLLIPGLVSLCGFVIFGTVGSMVWRRAPRRVGAISAVPAQLALNFPREVIRTYSFPMVMFALAIIPGLNFTYSGHGGISWFFVPLCFPWVIVRILIKIAKGSEASSMWYKRFFKITIPSYIAIALPLSWAAAASIHMTFGLPISTWAFFALMVSPFPWWYFT